ncbi:MAG: beta galactosidase jelly roll domain-containing protein [Oscillospiraceae bacterium]|nr:beta galactosidase jelly roll domain-containing protein [Oscillospiraceae bacterium]
MKNIDLNGQWDFIADLDPKYHEDKKIYQVHPYSQPKTVRRHWQKATVPGVWQKYGERYDIFEGVCWFAREFFVDVDEITFARLRFGGVNYLCDVYVNGQYAGSHEGGYTEFTLEATKHIHKGTNHIAVKVDNRATAIKWPPCLGYFNYGGIHRDVSLEFAGGPCFSDVALSAVPEKTGYELNVKASVKNCGCSRKLTMAVCCNSQSAKVPVLQDGEVEALLNLQNVQSWHPDNPALYQVSVTLSDKDEVLDTFSAQYGFKTITAENAAIKLNQRPFRFNGVCYVYDSPVSGLAMTPEQLKTDIALIKEMGANAVRCHYPMDKIFYEICDREGILVWIEPPVYCYHPDDRETGTRFSDKEWSGLAKQMICEMIDSAKNHPCAAIYGIGNECNTKNPEAQEFFASLASAARAKDPGRLVSYAALYGIVGPIADIVDVLGINSYWGWYDKVFGGKGLAPEGTAKTQIIEREPIDLSAMREMIDRVIHEGKKGLALFLTEFGADSVPGFYAAGRDLWSENYHGELLEEIFGLADEYPQIIGLFPFCFADYRDPSKTSNGYWNELNLKGAVTYSRDKKLAFEAIRKKYLGD